MQEIQLRCNDYETGVPLKKQPFFIMLLYLLLTVPFLFIHNKTKTNISSVKSRFPTFVVSSSKCADTKQYVFVNVLFICSNVLDIKDAQVHC